MHVFFFFLIYLSKSLYLQRDLDFTLNVDFKGQLCEVTKTSEYRMR